MKDHSANIKGRVFPTIDFANAGVHTGKHGGNAIDQTAFADTMDHGSSLVRSGQLTAVAGTASVVGRAGEKRRLIVTNEFELPD